MLLLHCYLKFLLQLMLMKWASLSYCYSVVKYFNNTPLFQCLISSNDFIQQGEVRNWALVLAVYEILIEECINMFSICFVIALSIKSTEKYIIICVFFSFLKIVLHLLCHLSKCTSVVVVAAAVITDKWMSNC